ncbi:3-deoxy-manno-octulosonate cytidylyltransferase [Paracoccus seriniphilus]|uniref:3-deoxy-manno-octulosonate cytidylyltransferase (CMP-KDO synthetase) n=1 Tax=Paracoccus seriniphilus TaxID=184748 RepID=A0A239PMB4_9RHOB|nr:3-deoxy-manno-octulosonate cytidylyltransferase [Paracoccus seriniphilus]WCR13859.1 3-deoxy-manno-octulosonate cytidylyltransferase [Paracoccus seriniphilus]SNT68519.1 3-deoxy-manno-octulosonate cytidylyltransferase (CMP-KDO synthetase) [Paracoccus seriniphilus]
MSVVIIIPARHASSRYPGKPLVDLRGAGGEARSLIRRSWDAASAVSGADRVVIATDDSRIQEHAEGFGAEVVMTSEQCRNGTERCAEAIANLGISPEIVVNLQGDAPLTPAWFVEDLVAGLRADPQAGVATPVLRCSGKMRADLIADRMAGRVGGTTAVFGADKQALYFSKEVLPYAAGTFGDDEDSPVFHHVGVYAYRPDALASYAEWGEGPLERLEGLEQLRFLERGRRLLCVEVEARGRQFWELNNPEDVPRLEAMMQEMGID